jgi:serine/threonine protein kinase
VWLSKHKDELCQRAIAIAENMEQPAYPAALVQSDERDSILEHNPTPDLLSTDVVTLIAWKDLRDEVVLGQGAYGEVHRMKWMGQPVAVKYITAASGDQDLIEATKAEAKVMAVLHHPCIVSLYGLTVDGPCGLVMEYCSKGTLTNYLRNNPVIELATKIQMAIQTTSGVAYLHAHNVVHRDIKSNNVMLDGELRCRLIDFGFAEMKQHLSTIGVSSTKGASLVGTLPWMAPEIIAHDDPDVGIPYNKSTDIYALGVTLWEIVAQKIPYQSLKGNVGLIAVWKAQAKFEPVPQDTPIALAQAILRCCSSTPVDRPSAVEILHALDQ